MARHRHLGALRDPRRAASARAARAKGGVGLGGRHGCGAGAPRSRPLPKKRSVSLIETVTLIAMVLIAGRVSSRLVKLIKSARWGSRTKVQVVAAA
jgi:hypothetical protein